MRSRGARARQGCRRQSPVAYTPLRHPLFEHPGLAACSVPHLSPLPHIMAKLCEATPPLRPAPEHTIFPCFARSLSRLLELLQRLDCASSQEFFSAFHAECAQHIAWRIVECRSSPKPYQSIDKLL